jgi:hypothetical protein
MRRISWMLAGALALSGPARPSPGGPAFRTVADASEWCDDGNGSWREVRHCEVREAVWEATGAPIAVDAQPNGGIQVTGWDRNEVRLLAKVVASGESADEARASAAAVRIETDGTIRASVGPEGGTWVSFRLQVPRAAALSLRSHNGGINLESLSGTVEARTTNGGVHLERMAGKVTARTQNGGVHVDLEGDSWDGEGLDVETSNGGVHLEVPADYNAHLVTSTVNGRIHAPAALRGRFEGKRLDTDLGRGGAPVRIETRNGGVHVNQG